MSTERIAALTVLDDSAKDWRFERNKELQWVLDDSTDPPVLYLRVNPALVKTAAGDISQILFREGTEKGSSTKYRIRHNAAGELEIYSEASGSGLKVAASGAVTGALPAGFPTILTGTLTYNPLAIAALGTDTTTITVTGATVANSAVFMSLDALLDPSLILDGYVSAANTVTMRLRNFSTGSINETSHVWRATVFQY